MICIEAKGIKKSYQDSDQMIKVLAGLDLSIETGELVSVTGQSGCGKSTLLHLLGLLDSPDEGTIELLGSPVSSTMPNAAQIRNQDLGFVFQFHYLIDDLSALHNVALPLLIAGHKSAYAMSEAQNLLARFNMASRVNHYPNQLSGGEQQRVALARALINKPKIVFADEPTGNLDPEHSMEVWNLIQEMNKELKQTFVIVTHDATLAALADSEYVLKNGVLDRVLA